MYEFDTELLLRAAELRLHVDSWLYLHHPRDLGGGIDVNGRERWSASHSLILSPQNGGCRPSEVGWTGAFPTFVSMWLKRLNTAAAARQE